MGKQRRLTGILCRYTRPGQKYLINLSKKLSERVPKKLGFGWISVPGALKVHYASCSVGGGGRLRQREKQQTTN